MQVAIASDHAGRDYKEATIRIRPKTMAALPAFIGLVPIMIGADTGAISMQRLTALMIGGLVTR